MEITTRSERGVLGKKSRIERGLEPVKVKSSVAGGKTLV